MSSMSAPTAELIAAISLINEILAASPAFAAYFASSADRRETVTTGRVDTLIERRHGRGGFGVRRSHHDAVGMQEVIHRGFLAHELGVGDHGDPTESGLSHHPVDPVSRSHRHGALRHHRHPGPGVLEDTSYGAPYEPCVWRAIRPGRRMDREEDEL
jgi:hypothetical protein